MSFYSDPVFWIYLVIIVIIAVIGYFITQESFKSGWYGRLNRQGIPPGPIFGIVWTLLYIFILIGVYQADHSARVNGNFELVTIIRTFFAFQILLNLLWTFAFFSSHNVELCFYITLLLMVVILYNIAIFYPVSPWGSFLYFFYFAWVSFALTLTYNVWKNNERTGLLCNSVI